MYAQDAGGRVSVGIGALIVGFGLMIGTGCDPGMAGLLGLPAGMELFPPAEAMEARAFLGGSAERLMMARTPAPEMPAGMEELAEFDPLRPWEFWESLAELEEFPYEPPATEVYAVNLRTLESEMLRDNVPADAHTLRSDGRWLAWFDYFDEVIRVIDMDSGAQSSYFPGLADGRILDMVTVQDGRLILEAGLPSYVGMALVVIDLDTQEQLVVAPTFLAGSPDGYYGQLGSVLIDDGQLFVHVWPPFDQETGLDLSAPLISTIDTVDLATGERSTLIPDAGEHGGRLYLADGRILVLSTPWDAPVTIRSFPLDGGAPETLAEFDLAPTETRWIRVAGFNERGVLINTSEEKPLSEAPWFSMSEWLDFRAYDGSTTRIADSASEGLSYAAPLDGQLIDEYVVYRDPETYEDVVLDLTTQSERRFDLFGE